MFRLAINLYTTTPLHSQVAARALVSPAGLLAYTWLLGVNQLGPWAFLIFVIEDQKHHLSKIHTPVGPDTYN